MTKRLTRSEVAVEQTWDLSRLYASVTDWEADLARVDALLPEIAAYKGKLGSGAGSLLACLRLRDQINQTAGRVYFYASHNLSVDQGNPACQALSDKATAMHARMGAALSFINPELLSLPDGTVEGYLEAEPALSEYRLNLLDTLAEKAHMLGEEAEMVLAQFSELAQAPYAIWQSTAYADVTFEPITDERGEQAPMSQVGLFRFLQSPDRRVRAEAYESAFKAWNAHKRTIAATFATAQKRDVILARLRKYPNALAAALAPNHLPESLFHNLLQVIEEKGTPHYRRYMEFRRRALGLEQLMPWDLNAPLDADFDPELTWSDACRLIKEALAPLGPEYGAILDQAFSERWIDRADNEGKDAGAYSDHCHAFNPIILMTWQDKLSDAFTLAHELGHAVHSVFSAKHQPYISADYNLFLAEMASTTNELLLARYLLKTTSSREMKRYVLNRAVSAFHSNFFGAGMMAALQLKVHQMVEQGEPLTYEAVTEVNSDCWRRWYGETVGLVEGARAIWMRPPHHYFNFYSYQYATGISAAAAFSDAILNEGAPAVERYLRFLSAGCSKHSLDILKDAGIDMTTPAPIERAVKVYAELVDELERV